MTASVEEPRPARRKTQPKPKPQRFATWLHGDPLGEFEAGRCVSLMLTVGGDRDHYGVEFLGDRWTMTKLDPSGELHQYTLTSDLTECGCPQSRYRPHGEPCRHRAALNAALLAAKRRREAE